ncbi:MAG: hypothetical protein IMY67_11165 [Bacteroidetes bacterium]|nr:hypothetical protein [Bacteroidota bacterium]
MRAQIIVGSANQLSLEDLKESLNLNWGNFQERIEIIIFNIDSLDEFFHVVGTHNIKIDDNGSITVKIDGEYIDVYPTKSIRKNTYLMY